MLISKALTEALPGTTTWDKDEQGSIKGLHLRVFATGQRSFYLYYKTKGGQERRPKLGDASDLPLKEARARAKILTNRVALGEDPKGAWDLDKAEITVGALFTLCFDEHWDADRYQLSGWASKVSELYHSLIEPTFANQKISQVTARSVREWHQSLNVTPIRANRGLEVLSRMFRFAEEKEYRPQGLNPCLLVKAFKEAKRKRYATEQELKKIMAILIRDAVTNPRASAFLYLLIFTGARPRSLERATWNMLKTHEVDGRFFGVLTFDGKTTEETGEQEVVVLPPSAMAIVEKLPKTSDKILGIQMPSVYWNKVRIEAGCPDLWARDLRRTFATVGMGEGAEIGVIGELLNHKTTQTTKIYAKLVDAKRIEAVSQIANKMDQILKGEK